MNIPARILLKSAAAGLIFGLLLALLLPIPYLAALFLLFDHGHIAEYCTNGGACGPNCDLCYTPLSQYGVAFGYIPSLIIGPLAGLIIGILVPLFAHSRERANLIGGVTGVLPWVILGLGFTIGFIFYVVPGIVSGLAGRWLGQRIFRQAFPGLDLPGQIDGQNA